MDTQHASGFRVLSKKYYEAVKAYETAADRYYDQPDVAADALFSAGMAYNKLAYKADYDQSLSVQAIETLGDFIALYPGDDRVPEAEEVIMALQNERAHGSYQIAKFYEKRRRWLGAMVYYNEVIELGPESPYAEEALERIEALNNRVRGAAE